MSSPVPDRNASFHTTQWSLVVAAGQREGSGVQPALTALCQRYWSPLYAYARRRGFGSDDASDCVQSFFVQLLEKPFLRSADKERGRFRTFLLTAFQRFLANELDRRHAIKRGGLVTMDPRDVSEVDSHVSGLTNNVDAESIFERRWALTLLNQVLLRLEQEMKDKGRQDLFDLCRGFLVLDDSRMPVAEIAAKTQSTESAVKVFVYRLRNRYRELLMEEVRSTVDHDRDVPDELQSLFRAVQG